MRASKTLAPLAALTAALAAAGCGLGGSPASPHHVALSISAPTSGATVAVRQVTVLGNVTPNNARVLVNGQAATVSGDSYKRTLYVSAAQQTITVVGQASGYQGDQATTTVNYSPALASQLNAATSRLRQNSAPAAAGSQLSPASKNQLQAAVSLAGGGQHGSSPAAKSSTPQKPSGSPSSGGNGSSGSAGNPPAGGSSGGSSSGGSSPAPTGNPSRPSGPTPAQVRAAIKKAYLGTCVKSEKGKNLVSYCRCMYNHLESAGSLSSLSRLRALRKAMQPYYRTHDPKKLPRVFRRAIAACQHKLPPADPLGGRPTVTKFPGVGSAPAAPSSSGSS